MVKRIATHHDDIRVLMKFLFKTIGVQSNIERVYRIASLSKPSTKTSALWAGCETVPVLP